MMDTLPNVNTIRGGSRPSHAGLTSDVSPEVQSPEAENSHTGVTSNFVPMENTIIGMCFVSCTGIPMKL